MSNAESHDIVYRSGAPLDRPQSRYPGFAPGRTTLRAGTVVKPGATPLTQDLTFDRDVAVEMRDGTTIYADVYRAADADAPLPTVTTWSPYGKKEGYMTFDDYPYRAGVPQRLLSGLDKFEGPDPAWWCARGYAVVNPDSRGAYRSEGTMAVWDEQEGEDGHDLVEWVAAQEWSSGKVGMCGTSWLTTTQWFTAAERPPHLSAIAPWEGLGDGWRFTFFDGGIPDGGFISALLRDAPSETGIEDIAAMLAKYPEFNDHWARKRAATEKIDIPTYAVMSWGGKLHSLGFFDAWHRLETEDRWLRLGPDLEWPGFYKNRYQHDLLRFFDYFLKGEENGWRETPRVRMSVVDFAGDDLLDRAEADFPVTWATPVSLHLTEASAMVGAPVETAAVGYDASEGMTTFEFTFSEPNEINGYPELRLFIEADGSDDADVFVQLLKLSPEGEVQLRYLISREQPEFAEKWPEIEEYVQGDGRALFAYDGPWRRQRASRRAVPSDPRATPVYPPAQPLSTGEVVELVMTLPPTAMVVRTGETIRLTVAGHNSIPPMLPGMEPPILRNRGRHVIHVGGDHPSRLILPFATDIT